MSGGKIKGDGVPGAALSSTENRTSLFFSDVEG